MGVQILDLAYVICNIQHVSDLLIKHKENRENNDLTVHQRVSERQLEVGREVRLFEVLELIILILIVNRAVKNHGIHHQPRLL